MNGTAPAEFLARFPTVLLDFDGPVCSVFSSFASAQVADALRERLGLVDAVPASTDPFDVLRFAADTGSTALAESAHQTLADLETEAAATAEPTPGTFELVDELVGRGRRLAIVSNNSAQAVRAFLDVHSLEDQITAVAARTDPRPTLLKPHPYLVSRGCDLTRSPARNCVLIGDSLTDLEAARACSVAFIGYANKPGKREVFDEHAAAPVVHHMGDLSPTKLSWPISGA